MIMVYPLMLSNFSGAPGTNERRNPLQHVGREKVRGVRTRMRAERLAALFFITLIKRKVSVVNAKPFSY